MKVVALKDASLDACVSEAQSEKVVITREGKPIALVVGVEGLDQEQLELGANDEFWTLIKSRRMQETVTRAELEKEIRQSP